MRKFVNKAILRITIVIVLCGLTHQTLWSQIDIFLNQSPNLTANNPLIKGVNEAAFSAFTEFSQPNYYPWVDTMDVHIVRWPGGNRGNDYRWQEHYLSSPNDLNIVNFSSYLNTTGMQGNIVVNFGNGNPTEAANLVSFCNSTDLFWETQRNSIGIQNPLQIKYWEIGNEVCNPWTWGYSWVGYPRSTNPILDSLKVGEIFFRTGDLPKYFPKSLCDSLYYFGGKLWREGWINGATQNDVFDPILGQVFVNPAGGLTTVDIMVDYPRLVTDSLRVFMNTVLVPNPLPPNFDYQAIYDALTNPNGLLSPAQVMVLDSATVRVSLPTPTVPNTVFLVEYLSTGHAGSFAFRDSMLVADSTIQIGYEVALNDSLTSKSAFQQSFAASPPDFMIIHDYPNISKDFLAQDMYSEIAQLPSRTTDNQAQLKLKFDSIADALSIPHFGSAISEWNVALCEECTASSAFHGITGSLYCSMMLLKLMELEHLSLADIQFANHFALSAWGNNIIHLLHYNNGVWGQSNTSKAFSLINNAFGSHVFEVDSVIGDLGIPIVIDALGNTEIQDATFVLGGMSGTAVNQYNLAVVNLDDESSHTLNIHVPDSWNLQTINGNLMHATNDVLASPDCEILSFSLPVNNSLMQITLPPYSFAILNGASFCKEDFNLSGYVDVGDLLILLADLSLGTHPLTDLNGYGIVDMADFLTFLSAFGTSC